MAQFDGLFSRVSQCEGFRQYMVGLLLPADRNKTLTVLANAEPIVGAQTVRVQNLQWYLSESRWDWVQVNAQRLALLIDADCVRAILQNRTYLGYVKYQQYDQHSDGRRSWKNPIEWIKGKHDPIIDEGLFNRCQEIRYAKAQYHEYYPKYRFYLLRDIIYCAECVANMPDNVDGDTWGKMHCQSTTEGRNLYYRCRARDFGRECSQSYVRAEEAEEHVINIRMGQRWGCGRNVTETQLPYHGAVRKHKIHRT